MFNLDGDLMGGLIATALLFLMAALAIIAGRRQPAETFTETINTEY